MRPLFTGETLLAALRRRRAAPALVWGDPLGRFLGEVAGGGVEIVSASQDPFTQDLHAALLLRGKGDGPDSGFAARLAAAEPGPKGPAEAAAAVLADLGPGTSERGQALLALVLSLAACECRPSLPWTAAVDRYWARVRRNGGGKGHHEVWLRSPAEMLLRGTYHALVLFLQPTGAEEALRRQAARLGYPPPPEPTALLAARTIRLNAGSSASPKLRSRPAKTAIGPCSSWGSPGARCGNGQRRKLLRPSWPW